jgi:hypothetical protein
MGLQVINKPEAEEDKTQDKVKEFFLKIAGEDLEVDWMELKEILDYAMRNGNLLWSHVLNVTLMSVFQGCNTSPKHMNTVYVCVDTWLCTHWMSVRLQ